jgi:acyl carrier protein
MSIQDSPVLSSPLVLDDYEMLRLNRSVTQRPRSAMEIQTWIVDYLAQLLEVDPADVDVAIPFDRYGLDSAAAVGMTGELADWLDHEIDPTVLYDYPTIESLVQYLNVSIR